MGIGHLCQVADDVPFVSAQISAETLDGDRAGLDTSARATCNGPESGGGQWSELISNSEPPAGHLASSLGFATVSEELYVCRGRGGAKVHSRQPVALEPANVLLA